MIFDRKCHLQLLKPCLKHFNSSNIKFKPVKHFGFDRVKTFAQISYQVFSHRITSHTINVLHAHNIY